jgi:cytochrome b561
VVARSGYDVAVSLRNDDRGYGVVPKSLHRLTVLAVAAQFAIGYLLDDDGGHGRGRGRGGSGHGRGHGGEDDPDLLKVHVALGLTILTLAVIRVLWRRTGLPPCDPRLSPATSGSCTRPRSRC